MEQQPTQYCINEQLKILFIEYDTDEWPLHTWIEYTDEKF
jgi:hypothetical protein